MAGLTNAEEAKLLDDRYDGVELWFAKSVVESYGGTVDYRYSGDDPVIRLCLRTGTAPEAPSPPPDATTAEGEPSVD